MQRPDGSRTNSAESTDGCGDGHRGSNSRGRRQLGWAIVLRSGRFAGRWGAGPLALWMFLLPAHRPAQAAEATATEARDVEAAAQAISTDELQQIVNYLADDAFEGREAGSRGGRAAGSYLELRLEKQHLQGASDDGRFFQDFGASSRNILARLDGSSPELKKQTIIVSAHYDHVGYGKPTNSFGPIGFIHKGADDNASGVAGLLALTEALGRMPRHPRRTILFALWDGEEQGLLGSRYWLEHPTVPLADVPILLNMDMIGRLRGGRVEIYGTRTAPGLRGLLSHENDGLNLLLDFHWEMRADSDHYPFYEHGIPDLLLHTGLHADYHRPSDTADKINATGIRQVTQLALHTVVDLADAPTLAGFRDRSRNEGIADKAAFERPEPPVPDRLGIGWDDAAEKELEQPSKTNGPGHVTTASGFEPAPENPADTSRRAAPIPVLSAPLPSSMSHSPRGLRVGHVAADSPAERAGLLAGDRILGFAGRDVTSAAEFQAAVLSAANPVAILVARAGAEKPLELSAQLAGEPIHIGIAWQMDEAEPQSVTIVRVVPNSPADRAGLKLAERIYKVSGKEFSTSDEFEKLLMTGPNPLELRVENAGRMRMVKLERR